METVPVTIEHAGRSVTFDVPKAQWDALGAEGQEQQIRNIRVQLAGEALRKGPGYGPEPGSIRDRMSAVSSEFTRNYTGGLDAYAGAAVTGIPFLNREGAPLNGLDFWERRDAIRASQDMQSDAIPDWLDNTVSLAGAVGIGAGPLAKSIHGAKNATVAGATIGGMEAVGHSEATNLPDLFTDAGIGTTLGAGAGLGAELLLDKVLGETARTVFADPGGNSPIAYHAQQRLGLPPSVGSIGNDLAASIENSFARSPSAAVSAAVPGRSALGLVQEQQALLEGSLAERVTDPMRGSSGASRTPDQLNETLRTTAELASDRLGGKINALEADFERAVPAGTPVNIENTRALPGDMRAEHSARELWEAAQREIDAMNANDLYMVDTVLGNKLLNDKALLAQQLGGVEGQLRMLNSGSPEAVEQAARLRATAENLRDQIDAKDEEIFANMGPAFKAAREQRNLAGQDTQRPGLTGRTAKQYYGRVNEDLAAAAERVRPGAGDEMRKMFAQESEMITDRRVLDKIADRDGNYARFAGAVRAGRWDELDVILNNMDPDLRPALQADLMDMLGRGRGKEFDAGTFRRNWFEMSDAAKQKLFDGNPEGLAVAETIAEVALDLTNRGRMDWHSNTPAGVGLMAFFGAAIASPRGLVKFLAVTGVAERAFVSEALAKAVAGERTQMGALLRRAAIAWAASEAPTSSDLQEGVQ